MPEPWGELVHNLGRLQPGPSTRELVGVTFEGLNARVAQFYELLPTLTTHEQLRSALHDVLFPSGHGRLTFVVSVERVDMGTAFYRTRRIQCIEQDLRTTEDIREPKPEYVKSSGRLNISGEPILYTSRESPTTALLEGRFEAGDLVAVTRFEARDFFKSTVVGEGPVVEEVTEERQLMRHAVKDFLDGAFSAKPSAEHPEPYRLSRFLVREFWDLPKNEVTGWAFRSTLDPEGGSWNFSFEPSEGRRVLSYKDTHVYRLLSSVEAGKTPKVELRSVLRPGRGNVLREIGKDEKSKVRSYWPAEPTTS